VKPPPPPVVLVVDDEPMFGKAVTRLLQPDYVVVAETDPRLAMHRLSAGEEFSAILCDLRMPGCDGLTLHRFIETVRPSDASRVVFVTGALVDDVTRERLPAPVLEKPFDATALRDVLRRACGDTRCCA
jgi:CheY-like chemotaxis protein